MAPRLPIKLKKEPLIDAIFEVRFSASASAANILPGFFFSRLKGNKGIERLPTAELPKPIRDNDSNLRYAPLVRIQLDNFIVSVGDSSLVVGCKLPYPGWSEFKPKILEILRLVGEIGIVQVVQRFSMKYIDLIPSDDIRKQVSMIRSSVTIGDHTLEKESFSLRMEIHRDKTFHIVSVVSSAVAVLQNGSQRNGIIVDIDTIEDGHNQGFNAWLGQVESKLDAMHLANKEMFFECLRPETIAELEPVYE